MLLGFCSDLASYYCRSEKGDLISHKGEVWLDASNCSIANKMKIATMGLPTQLAIANWTTNIHDGEQAEDEAKAR